MSMLPNQNPTEMKINWKSGLWLLAIVIVGVALPLFGMHKLEEKKYKKYMDEMKDTET